MYQLTLPSLVANIPISVASVVPNPSIASCKQYASYSAEGIISPRITSSKSPDSADFNSDVRSCNERTHSEIYSPDCHLLTYLKPQSDIRCNRFATSPRLTIYTNRRGRNKVPDWSRRGCREVGDWSGTSLRPNQTQPTSRRPIAD